MRRGSYLRAALSELLLLQDTGLFRAPPRIAGVERDRLPKGPRGPVAALPASDRRILKGGGRPAAQRAGPDAGHC